MANISKLRLSGVTYTIVDETAIHDLSNYYTTAQTDSQITAATSALAQTIEEAGYQNASQVNAAITAVTNPINETLTAHTANTEIHVTLANKEAWNAKLDAADVEGFFGAVNYDKESKRINFYNTSTGGTVLGYVDATDFIKDGMVSNVEIKEVAEKGVCLVITFNSDSGKKAIEIPISQIFNADNYYTKSQTDSAIAAYTYDKATIDQKVAEGGTFDPSLYYDKTETDNLLANKADKSTTYTKNDVDNAITAATSTKQDKLVSGTNIKTVGAQSVLGSGNIALMTAHVGTGNDSETLIFDFA